MPYAFNPFTGSFDYYQASGTNVIVSGRATLSNGTVTVSNGNIAANSPVLLSYVSVSGVQGILSLGTIVAATSFVINSTSDTDNSIVGWVIPNGPASASGQANLVNGTITIPAATVTSSSAIQLGYGVVSGVPGILFVSSISSGVSFTVTSTSDSDNSTINWMVP